MANYDDPVLIALSQAVDSDPTNIDTKKLFSLELYKRKLFDQAYPILCDVFNEDKDIAVERAIYQIQKILGKPNNSQLGFEINQVSEDEILKELVKKKSDKVSFSDVAGMEEIKESIRMKILYPMQNPEMAKTYGLKAGGGILMYGPPGCGKTFIAKATAGELDATFISVSIHEIASAFAGEGERALHNIFANARRQAPAVIFFDEIDAVGANRNKLSGSMRTLVNQFLIELDGVGSDNKELLVIGATNLPWAVDDALRRPGRFDQIQFITPPDFGARKKLFQMNFKDKPVEAINYNLIASATENFSAADISKICKESLDIKFREAMKTSVIVKLSTEDIVECINKNQPTTTEWFKTAKNYVTYSNQSGLYDDVAKYIEDKNL